MPNIHSLQLFKYEFLLLSVLDYCKLNIFFHLELLARQNKYFKEVLMGWEVVISFFFLSHYFLDNKNENNEK